MPKKPVITKAAIAKQGSKQDLQLRAEEFVSGELLSFASDEMSLALKEQFMGYVEAYEEAEWITSFDLLEQGGMELPSPEELDDSQLTIKLWEVIRGLAMLRMFLYSTDHLSDRELYEKLWHEVLREENPDMPFNDDAAYHIDLLGSGSGEDVELYLRYYADEDERDNWAHDWPTDVMPEHEALPYDRDRHLPARDQAEWKHHGRLS